MIDPGQCTLVGSDVCWSSLCTGNLQFQRNIKYMYILTYHLSVFFIGIYILQFSLHKPVASTRGSCGNGHSVQG